MKVAKAAVVGLLQTLGVDTADGWSAAKISSKLNAKKGIGVYNDPKIKLNKHETALFEELEAAHKKGTTIEVEDAEAAKGGEKAAQKKAAAAKAKPKAERVYRYGKRTADMTWKEKIEAWKKNPYPLTGRGAGVVATIIEELKAAGKGKNPKPVDKTTIHGVLVAKFAERDADKMRITVNNQVPTQLRQYRQMNVVQGVTAEGKKGYYIPGTECEIPAGHNGTSVHTKPAKKETAKAKASSAGNKKAAAAKKKAKKKATAAA